MNSCGRCANMLLIVVYRMMFLFYYVMQVFIVHGLPYDVYLIDIFIDDYVMQLNY